VILVPRKANKSAPNTRTPWLLQYQEHRGFSNLRAHWIALEQQAMNREYHKWYSTRLGRDMELLVFGHAGLPVLVFPTSGGRFYEFEDRGMIGSVGSRIDAGDLQFFCVDSVDMESWYNRNVGPRWRIARHVQYQDYLIHEVVPLIHQKRRDSHLVALGCSFGGYHAVNIALRHPDIFSGFLSMSGAFDLSNFLGAYYDQDVYFNMPMHYLPNLADPWYFQRYNRNTYILGTGWDDQCLWQNQELDRIMSSKNIPHKIYTWETWNSHDWPTWQRMIQEYL
jgi:esterase/lipase superfamily enzyme